MSDGATATPAREPRAVASPLLFCWMLVAGVTTLPYVLAALRPPPGRAFVGTFHWIDDFHNYLSFVQQALGSYVVLPGDPGPVPEAWLGPGSPFRRLARVGTPPRVISVYGRASGERVRLAP